MYSSSCSIGRFLLLKVQYVFLFTSLPVHCPLTMLCSNSTMSMFMLWMSSISVIVVALVVLSYLTSSNVQTVRFFKFSLGYNVYATDWSFSSCHVVPSGTTESDETKKSVPH